jgi:hypothetical protein
MVGWKWPAIFHALCVLNFLLCAFKMLQSLGIAKQKAWEYANARIKLTVEGDNGYVKTQRWSKQLKTKVLFFTFI